MYFSTINFGDKVTYKYSAEQMKLVFEPYNEFSKS